MNTEALLKFIKEMKESGQEGNQLERLLEYTEEMLNLIMIIENSSRDDFIQIAKKKLPVVGKALNEEYLKVLNEMKTSPEQLKALANDSKNFTPAQWQEMERLRSEMGFSEKPPETESSPTPQKIHKKARLRA